MPILALQLRAADVAARCVATEISANSIFPQLAAPLMHREHVPKFLELAPNNTLQFVDVTA